MSYHKPKGRSNSKFTVFIIKRGWGHCKQVAHVEDFSTGTELESLLNRGGEIRNDSESSLFLEGWKWLVWFETYGKWDKLSWKQATWHQWEIYWLFLSISKGLINFGDSFLEEHFKCLWRRAKRSDMDRDHSPLSVCQMTFLVSCSEECRFGCPHIFFHIWGQRHRWCWMEGASNSPSWGRNS